MSGSCGPVTPPPPRPSRPPLVLLLLAAALPALASACASRTVSRRELVAEVYADHGMHSAVAISHYYAGSDDDYHYFVRRRTAVMQIFGPDDDWMRVPRAELAIRKPIPFSLDAARWQRAGEALDAAPPAGTARPAGVPFPVRARRIELPTRNDDPAEVFLHTATAREVSPATLAQYAPARLDEKWPQIYYTGTEGAFHYFVLRSLHPTQGIDYTRSGDGMPHTWNDRAPRLQDTHLKVRTDDLALGFVVMPLTLDETRWKPAPSVLPPQGSEHLTPLDDGPPDLRLDLETGPSNGRLDLDTAGLLMGTLDAPEPEPHTTRNPDAPVWHPRYPFGPGIDPGIEPDAVPNPP